MTELKLSQNLKSIALRTKEINKLKRWRGMWSTLVCNSAWMLGLDLFSLGNASLTP